MSWTAVSDGGFVMMTTGTAFNPARADWTLNHGDPQQSRTRRLPAPSTEIRLAPVADAYVRDGSYAGTNFGTATTLVVKNTTAAGNNRISYLRFPLTGVGSDVAAAKLRVYGQRPVAHAAVTNARGVSSNTWTETGVTWNNKPALGTVQAGVTVGITAQYWEWDVTAFVRAQRAAGVTSASLALEMATAVNDGPDAFNSREAASNRPQLVVTSRP